MRDSNVVLLAPNFAPESGAGAQRLTALAEDLTRAGYTVTVVTHLPHYPQNVIYEGYDVRSPMISHYGGADVVRLRPWIVPKQNFALRLLSEVLFSLQAAVQAYRREPDLVIASSPYMFLGPIGLAVAWARGARFIWDVRDLTWLYPRATGKRTFGLDRPLEALMKWTASKVDGLTTATDGWLRYFERRPARSYAIPNGVRDEWLDKLLEIGEGAYNARPVVTYAGLFGYNHGLATVVRAAALLPEFDFVLIGDGPERADLEGLARQLELTNIEFLGYVQQEQLVSAYARSDVLVSHVRRNPLFRLIQPAKMFEYMATGRPLVLAGEGETVEMIQQNELGFAVEPEQPDALAAAIRRAVEEPETAQSFARSARAFVDENRRRSPLNQRFLTLISDLLDRR